MANDQVRFFRDIGYVVSASLGQPDGLHVAFTAYEVAFEEDGRPSYWPDGAASDLPGTYEIAEAEWFVRGSVKWSGCSNVEFNCDDNLLHFCGPKSARNVSVLLERIYEVARKLMPKADFGERMTMMDEPTQRIDPSTVCIARR